MRIALYCRELRASGGRSIAIGLLNALARDPHGHEITAYVPVDSEYARLRGGAVRIVPKVTRGGATHLLAHHGLRRQLAVDRQDIVFMMGNLGLTHAPCPQVVLVHDPWSVNPESSAWRKCGFRHWVYLRIRSLFIAQGFQACDAVAAPTPVVVQKIHRLFGVPYDRLALIPNAETVAVGAPHSEGTYPLRMLNAEHRCRALCLARYMPHKNIEVLLPVADELIASGRTDIGIYVTVNPAQGAGARRLLREMGRDGRSRVMHNLGEVSMAEVRGCYESADALLLPTLLESFSGTYVDAMRAGVPIITSDRDFARVVCGDAASYINPYDHKAIISALDTLRTDQATWHERCACGRKRLALFFHGWDDVAHSVVSLLERVARGERAPELLDDKWVKDWAACSPPCDTVSSGSDRESREAK